MQVQNVSSPYNSSANFGMKFKLSEQSIKNIEKSTKLTYNEMKNLSSAESEKLMIERGRLKKSGKLRTWVSEQYKKIGEKFGLIEKKYNIYTDID